MKTFYRSLTLTIVLLAIFHSSFAQEAPKNPLPFKLLVGGGLELGGDEVAEVYFTNGNSQSVKAGQGGSLAVGTQFQFPSLQKLALRATVGFKYVTTAADNAHIRLTRVPIIVTGNYLVTDKFRVAAGLAMHQAIHFRADGIGPDMNFEPAKGPIFEIAYSGVGLTYTAMTYTDKNKHSYAANAVGLNFSITIPK